MMNNPDGYSALLRDSLFAFVIRSFLHLNPGIAFQMNWHIEHLCWQLERASRGAVRRLIINIPPRNGKSILTSVSLPAWILGHDPTKRIMCVSYAEELARQLSLDTRSVMESDWYRRTFPNLRLDRLRTLQLQTSSRGWREGFGAGGSIMGKGADIIIVDDPIKALASLSRAERLKVANFYDSQLYTRLNDKKTGIIIIIMQRLHEDDLVGHVLPRDEWEVVSIPATATSKQRFRLSDAANDEYVRPAGQILHPDREPAEILEQARRAMGSRMFSAQYQQEPLPDTGNVIKREWLRYFDVPPAFDRIIVSWDTASTMSEHSDYSVGTVWGARGLNYYLLDVVRVQLETPALRRMIIELSQRHGADATLIENTELGRAIAQELRASGELRVLTRTPQFDKEARLLAQSARFEAGQVHLPREAPWRAAYEAELLAFPNGTNDDQVDSTSQALLYLTGRSALDRPPVRRNIKRRPSMRPIKPES